MTEFEKELVRFVSGYLDAGVSAEDYVKAFSKRLLDSIGQQSKEQDNNKLGEIARHILAVKDHLVDMRLDDGEIELLKKLGYPERKEQEQPVCEGLEEEINRYLEPIHAADIQFEPFTQMTKCARHFAQWGAEHRGSSEIPKQLDEDAVDIADALLAKPKDYALSAKADYWNGAHDGVIAGAKWQKEMMLKEAVEGEVKHFATAHYVLTNEDQLTARLKQFQDGDKVRIIIVKED